MRLLGISGGFHRAEDLDQLVCGHAKGCDQLVSVAVAVPHQSCAHLIAPLLYASLTDEDVDSKDSTRFEGPCPAIGEGCYILAEVGEVLGLTLHEELDSARVQHRHRGNRASRLATGVEGNNAAGLSGPVLGGQEWSM